MMSTNTLQYNVLRKMILCIAEMAPWNHTRMGGILLGLENRFCLIRTRSRVRKRKQEGIDDSRYHMYCKFITNLLRERKELTHDCRGKRIRAKQSSSNELGWAIASFNLGHQDVEATK